MAWVIYGRHCVYSMKRQEGNADTKTNSKFVMVCQHLEEKQEKGLWWAKKQKKGL